MNYMPKKIKLNPQCINNEKEIALSATGWILPCCWCDNSTEDLNEFRALGFFDSDLKLENSNSLNEILTSDCWTNFYSILNNRADFAPRVCKSFCGVNYLPSKFVVEEK